MSLFFFFGSSDFGDDLELTEVILVCFLYSFGFVPLKVVLLVLLQVELMGMAILIVWAMEWTLLLLLAPLFSTLVSAVECASSQCALTHSVLAESWKDYSQQSCCDGSNGNGACALTGGDQKFSGIPSSPWKEDSSLEDGNEEAGVKMLIV